ncbi:hypothetical protein RGQ29_018297 [Quercus rubra]|uniref:Uncharacterized protein n=1 Tax=Quercus rubra TaxID=3512 RepID=A0AAN7FNP4_QUERU|nr:hypothetical protein RGQ29_018297 [Quercus rubra]
MDFAWTKMKMKMSGLNVLTGYSGQVRRNCSLPMDGGRTFIHISEHWLTFHNQMIKINGNKKYFRP